MPNMRHLVVMHGWTEDQIMEVARETLVNALGFGDEPETFPKMLEYRHDQEHQRFVDGYFETEELPAEERDARQKYRAQDHSH